MRKVLSIIHTPTFGGPHNYVLRMYQSLKEHGWEYTVLLPLEEGDGAARLQEAGIAVIQIELHRLRKVWNPRMHVEFFWNLPREIKTLRDIIQTEAFDLVQVCGIQNPQGALAAHLENTPVVWQLLSTYAPKPLRIILSPLAKRFADVVMSTGRTTALAHPGIVSLGKRWIPFYAPVDGDIFYPDQARRAAARKEFGIPDHALLVGTVGNFCRQKAHEYLIEAAYLLRQQHTNLFFRIVGNPVVSQKKYYQEKVIGAAQNYNLLKDGVLDFVIGGNRIPTLLPAIDVFVLPSRAEGVPTVALEAMACGIPVVATDVGSVGELVVNGETGFIVPPGDEKALVSSINRLIKEEQLRVTMGNNARERYKRVFSLAQCVEAFARAYDLAVVTRQSRTKV